MKHMALLAMALRGMWGNLASAAVVSIGLLASLIGCADFPQGAEATKQKAYAERYTKAKALFEERCKTAGVVITRTISDVEGIELAKIRQSVSWGGREYFDPMYAEAAMATEFRGESYIKQFLMSEFRAVNHPQERGSLGPKFAGQLYGRLPATDGYRFVEYLDEETQEMLRCVGVWTRGQINWVPGQHRCEKISQMESRYMLDYEDLLDPLDRQLWVAGTKLKVIDKRTDEVIAQLTRYVWDAGFGAGSTGRWPWVHAAYHGYQVCPSMEGTMGVSRFFVDTVLKPKQGE